HGHTSGLDAHGITTTGQVHWNLTTPLLFEHALRRNEGMVAADGPLVCRTGQHTGRSPNDKFVVKDASSDPHVHWGKVNRPMSPAQYAALRADVVAHIGSKDLYVQNLHAGADPEYRLPVRVVSELAWHSLFVRNLFIVPTQGELAAHEPEFTVICAPSFQANPAVHGTRSEVVVALNMSAKEVLIAGTSYAGENKKSIFSVLNYVLPLRGVLSMHCSANIGKAGDTALFFGLSGTGKTTLSSDPERDLIGDDEHGWSERGVFNFEGGCYAKTIRLSAEAEPQIYATTRRFGTVLENVVLDPDTRVLDLDSAEYTENTRAAYPIEFIDNAVLGGQGGHPSNIVMLTADAFGVLPPIARLSPQAAMYHFLSGYTAKVAGTEKGVTEPSATFSTCFGAPFLPLNPNVYSKMLGERIAKHQVRVWLVNTGWTGGAHGVGSRMKISHTRAMIRAALAGALDEAVYVRHPVFNVEVPTSCPGVPDGVLDPRSTWADPAAYDAQATKLARMFVDNFKTFAGDVDAAVVAAGPRG
ncbi:MAG TPA: phosphoenolpyruvate carboxykinase, partial [Vicinamibacterales bacterium]|nr:phosphoenolpyruvate carboxykinase [Vicinamibacterales bacterium]